NIHHISMMSIHPSTLTIVTSFFFTHTATTELYTLSLHDALPISLGPGPRAGTRRPPRPRARSGSPTAAHGRPARETRPERSPRTDRKSTRLNSSHVAISYAVFCLKKKKKK